MSSDKPHLDVTSGIFMENGSGGFMGGEIVKGKVNLSS